MCKNMQLQEKYKGEKKDRQNVIFTECRQMTVKNKKSCWTAAIIIVSGHWSDFVILFTELMTIQNTHDQAADLVIQVSAL